MKQLDTYLVICAVSRASGGHRQMMDVAAVSAYADVDPDMIRAVAAKEVLEDDPRLQFSRHHDQVGITVTGQDAIEAWDRQPYLLGELERRWIAEKRAGYTGKAGDRPEDEAPVAVPTGGSKRGGRDNNEEARLIRAMRKAGKPARLTCARCGKPGQIRKGRVCRRCEARAQKVRDKKKRRGQ